MAPRKTPKGNENTAPAKPVLLRAPITKAVRENNNGGQYQCRPGFPQKEARAPGGF